MTVQPNQGIPPSSINPLRDVNIVGGSINSSTTARATAAAPTYVEGVDSPVSQDLNGNLRISGSFSASFAESVLNLTGTASSATTIVTRANTVGYYSAFVQIEGIGTSTVVCEINNSGTWVPVTVENCATPGPLSAITVNGIYRLPTGGVGFRVRVSVYDGSATVAANVELRAFPVSTPVGGVPVTQSGTWNVGINAGSAVIGHVITDSGSTTSVSNFPASQVVTGTFFQATQPVSASSLPLPTGAATETTLGAVNTKLGGTLAVSGSFFQATQPVSGTFWQATQPVSFTMPALVAGSAIIGKVGIDQTTPGTTNLVAAGQTGTWTVQPGNTPNTAPWLVGHGKTLKTVAISALTADTDLVAAVSLKRIKVVAYALFTTGTSASTLAFKSNGTGGTLLANVLLQSQASAVFGANIAIPAPSFLFATVAGEKLTLDVGNTDPITGFITYFDDDAV